MTLRELRRRRHLTQDGAGYLGGLDGSVISRIERGLVTPTRRTVVRLAKAFDVAPATMHEIISLTLAAAVTRDLDGHQDTEEPRTP